MPLLNRNTSKIHADDPRERCQPLPKHAEIISRSTARYMVETKKAEYCQRCFK